MVNVHAQQATIPPRIISHNQTINGCKLKEVNFFITQNDVGEFTCCRFNCRCMVVQNKDNDNKGGHENAQRGKSKRSLQFERNLIQHIKSTHEFKPLKKASCTVYARNPICNSLAQQVFKNNELINTYLIDPLLAILPKGNFGICSALHSQFGHLDKTRRSNSKQSFAVTIINQLLSRLDYKLNKTPLKLNNNYLMLNFSVEQNSTQTGF